jgi:glucosamine-6-phosphate deaminase
MPSLTTLQTCGAVAAGAAVAYTLYRALAPKGIRVHVSADKHALAAAAAEYAARTIEATIDARGSARVIFATGASQFEFIEALLRLPVRWDCVTAFHLDEYVGLPISHGASFRKYLKERLFSKMDPPPAAVHYLDPEDVSGYEAALAAGDIDLANIGIGENGHIAFNDPPPGGCDFHDARLAKKVPLDTACRQQQLGEGWFATLDEVPTHAITLTVPAIMRCKRISCVVPDERKAKAVRGTLKDPISESCPGTILRTHPDCRLWLDTASAALL